MSIFNWGTTTDEEKKPSRSGSIFDWGAESNDSTTVEKAVSNITFAPRPIEVITPPEKKPYSLVGGIARTAGTGFKEMSVRFIDQLLRAPKILSDVSKKTRGLAGSPLLRGPQFDKVVNYVEDWRKKTTADRLAEVEAAKERNPYTETTGGQIVSTVAGIIPFIATRTIGAPVLALSASEALMNTQQSFEENIKNGMGEAEATKRAIPQFASDLAVTYLTDKYLGALGKIGKKTPDVAKDAVLKEAKTFLQKSLSVAGKSIGMGLSETGQELWQQFLQNIVTDKPATEGFAEVAKISFISSLFFGVPISLIEVKREGRANEIKRKVEEKLNTIKTKKENGENLTGEEIAIDFITQGKNPFTEPQTQEATPVELTKSDIEAIANEVKTKDGQETAFRISEEEAKTKASDEVKTKDQQEMALRVGEKPSRESIEEIGKYNSAEEFVKEKHPTIDWSIQENESDITLSKIKVPEGTEGAGQGTKAMEDLIRYADTKGKRIVLTPSKDFGATSVRRLVEFYKRFGFVVNRGRQRDFSTREAMLRRPNIDLKAKGIDNKAYGTNSISRSRREKTNEGGGRFFRSGDERMGSGDEQPLGRRLLSRYENSRRDDAKTSEGNQAIELTSGKPVKIDSDTSTILRHFGFSELFISKLNNVHQKGGITNIAIFSEFQGNTQVWGAYDEYSDTLYVNGNYIDSGVILSGDIINHEVGGHSWYFGLSPEGRLAFYNNLKLHKETIKKAWFRPKESSTHDQYWSQTIEQIKAHIQRVATTSVAEDVLKFVGLEVDSDITLDDFIERSLNLDKTISAINKELAERGLSPVTIKAEDTWAIREHNAVIAENASNLTTDDTSIVGRYISDIQDENLVFGENGVTSLMYEGEVDLSTKLLEKLRGRDTISKQFISDITNSGDIKQVERDIFRNILAQYPDGAQIPVSEFTEKVKAELLPLTIRESVDISNEPRGDYTQRGRYEFVTLPSEIRGDVANYVEHIYESPVKTSAGNIHFDGMTENYFGHTRIEDMADGKTRRVIEDQTDLYQKGNLEREQLQRGDLSIADEKSYATPEELKQWEYFSKKNLENGLSVEEKNEWDKLSKTLFERASEDKNSQISKLQQYNDPTAHFRMVREEIKKAAQDGKTKLQFPTGETAMKIEGLGAQNRWESAYRVPLKQEDLKVGRIIRDMGDSSNVDWVITDVIGDGVFTATPKMTYLKERNGEYVVWKNQEPETQFKTEAEARAFVDDPKNYENDRFSEAFSISPKIDTNNPIYRFYEKDLGRYLKNNYGAKLVTDAQGVTWYEIDIKPEMGEFPVMAFRIKKNPKFDSGNKMEDLRKTLAHVEKRVGAKPVDINKLENQLSRVEASLKEAESKPEAHKKAYGGDKVPEYKEKIQNIKERIRKGKQMNTITQFGKLSETELLAALTPENVAVEKVRSTPVDKIPLSEELGQKQFEIERLSLVIKQKENLVDNHPGKKLQQFISKKEGEFLDFKNEVKETNPQKAEALRKRREKILKVAESALQGTEYSEQFSDPEIIRELISDYQQQKASLEEMKKERAETKKEFYTARNIFYAEERNRIAMNNLVSKQERYKVLQEVEKVIRKEGQDRRKKVEAIRDFFYLTQKEINEISDFTDYRLLSDKEFDDFLKKVEEKSYEVARHTEARAEVEYTITQKNLKLTENLQEALGLSRNLKDLTIQELEKLNELLGLFEDNDVFLGKREIETLQKNTDLPEVKTQRQIIRALFPDIPIEKLKAIQVGELDELRSATSLSQENAFYEWMVLNLREGISLEEIKYRVEERVVNELAKKARASRKRSLLDSLVPTDKIIREYLEEPDTETKIRIAQTMTPEELEFAHYLQKGWQEARDYLIKQEVLEEYIKNYVTHRRRGFLEAWLKSDIPSKGKFRWIRGFVRAIKETFLEQNKLDEITFRILDEKTGKILPLEKFFQYAQRRSGNLIPTNNMATAYLGYQRTLGKKKVLDNYMPKLIAVTRAISPIKETKEGLKMDESLLNMVMKFVNTQKGRPDVVGPVKPGRKIDIAIRTGLAIVRFKFLALNFASQGASPIGEQYSTYITLGARKHARGIVRARTKQGKNLIKKFEGFIGESILEKLKNQSMDVGSKVGVVMFAGFSIASRQANLVHFLGELTPTEFKTGEVSPTRLAQMKNDMGRFRADDQLSGIMAKTSIGQMGRQFKSWAIPIASQSMRNLGTMMKIIKKDGMMAALKSREFGELFRTTVPALLILWAMFEVYDDLKKKRERTFTEQLQFKAMQEISTGLSAISPTTFLGQAPPLIGWLINLTVATGTFLNALRTGDKTREGTTPGAKQLKQTLTPSVFSQFKNKAETALDKAVAEEKAIRDENTALATAKHLEFKKLAETDKEAANAAYRKLRSEDPVLAAKVKDIRESEALGLTDIDKKIKSLGVESGARARYIYGEAAKLKTAEEKNAYIADLKKKKVATDEVRAQIKKMVAANKPLFEEDQETSEQGVINTIYTYARAIGADPLTAFNRLFTNQSIRRVDNGTVIINRNTTTFGKKGESGFSTKVRQERRATKGMYLDHTIPIQLGGADSRDNLVLISEEEWRRNTPVENYLGEQLRSGKLTKKEVQDLIVRFKNGELTAEEIIN